MLINSRTQRKIHRIVARGRMHEYFMIVRKYNRRNIRLVLFFSLSSPNYETMIVIIVPGNRKECFRKKEEKEKKKKEKKEEKEEKKKRRKGRKEEKEEKEEKKKKKKQGKQ